jgi:Zn-dependent M16 (insulinase) family peptidase
MDLTKFIIGAIGEYDTLTTPRLAGSKATADYLSGWTPADDAKVLGDMKSTDKDSLARVSSLLDKVFENAVICVVGSREHIEANKESFDSIIEI